MSQEIYAYRAVTPQELEIAAAPSNLNSIKELADRILLLEGSTSSDPISVRWSPNFFATGMTFTGTNGNYPTYNSYYVKNGKMVTFFIEINCSTVTNFGTGQFMTELPFDPIAGSMNHFPAWMLVSSSVNPDLAGHIVLQADHLASTKTLDLHWYAASTSNPKPVMESLLKQGSPLTLTNEVKMYINGTYICA